MAMSVYCKAMTEDSYYTTKVAAAHIPSIVIPQMSLSVIIKCHDSELKTKIKANIEKYVIIAIKYRL